MSSIPYKLILIQLLFICSLGIITYLITTKEISINEILISYILFISFLLIIRKVSTILMIIFNGFKNNSSEENFLLDTEFYDFYDFYDFDNDLKRKEK